MKIGVVSDTHSLLLPKSLFKVLSGVDLILHAGDICDASVLKELETIAPVTAVCGNMDNAHLKKKLPVQQVIECEGVTIGLCHGHMGTKDALTNAKVVFKGQSVKAIIYGHSHQAFNENIDGILYFNPGSPNDVIKAKFFSCGILTVEHNSVSGTIIKL